MRIRKRKAQHQLSLADHFELWGGVTLVFLAVAAFVDRTNSCAAAAVKNHPWYSITPGVEWGDIPNPAQKAVLFELNHRFCTCQCMMTLASCRNNHTSCRFSLRTARELVESARDNLSPADRH